MAGTDPRRGAGATGGPAVILVHPQLGENIGTTARAMLNCGLTDLRLVAPRDGWPNEKAVAAASGADLVLDGVRVFDSTADAVRDLARLWATTARPRHMVKPVVTPREAAGALRQAEAEGIACGVIFGPERAGLDNDDVTLADAVIQVPLNPGFSSLNLAQAVLVVAYEWSQAAAPPVIQRPEEPDQVPASRDEMLNFFEHLEGALDASGFLTLPEKRPSMVRNLRNLFLRGQPTKQEVRTLHGIVTALSGRHKDGRGRRGEE